MELITPACPRVSRTKEAPSVRLRQTSAVLQDAGSPSWAWLSPSPSRKEQDGPPALLGCDGRTQGSHAAPTLLPRCEGAFSKPSGDGRRKSGLTSSPPPRPAHHLCFWLPGVFPSFAPLDGAGGLGGGGGWSVTSFRYPSQGRAGSRPRGSDKWDVPTRSKVVRG